jgi:hypothetical protein
MASYFAAGPLGWKCKEWWRMAGFPDDRIIVMTYN